MAQGPAADKEAVAWVTAYRRAGGKAELAPGPDGRTVLAIQKRKGQTPLVSLKGFRPAPGVRAVTLQGYEVADEDLEALAGWKGLEEVHVVDGIKVTDAGVKAIAGLPNLHSVELCDTAVTGKGAAAFSKHESLIYFTLSNTIVEGQAKELKLTDMPKLATVSLAGEGITRVVLARLPQVREVSDFPRSLEVADLSGLGRVKDLDFGHTRLKALLISDVPMLESLDLRDTRLPKGAVKVLRNRYPTVSILP
jgi:hypothetical protein